jgi:L-threonylcarbamoyladenylate synthase
LILQGLGRDWAGSARVAQDLARAVELLRAGELVAMPTETVYGLAADAANPTAVAKIFAAKGRPADHPLIVHLPGAEAMERWARDIPDAAYRLAAAFWPGPLTLILKRQPQVSDVVTGGQDTIGLRVPDHRLALALLRSFGADDHGGLAAPSANRFGRISPTTAAHVREELGEQVPLILDGGPCQLGIESTIVDLSAADGVPRILRPGAIRAEALAQVLGFTLAGAADGAARTPVAPRVSGSLAAHYAPQTHLRLLAAAELLAALQIELAAGCRCAVLARTLMPPSSLPAGVIWQAAPAGPAAYAHELYATLRQLDAQGCDRLLVEAPPADELWQAVADRLGRAACGSGQPGLPDSDAP